MTWSVRRRRRCDGRKRSACWTSTRTSSESATHCRTRLYNAHTPPAGSGSVGRMGHGSVNHGSVGQMGLWVKWSVGHGPVGQMFHWINRSWVKWVIGHGSVGQMGQWVMGHGSNGSTNVDGSHGPCTCDPLPH